MGRRSKVPPVTGYRRRTFEVAAIQWKPATPERAEEIIAWLRHFGYDAKHWPSSGVDFYSSTSIHARDNETAKLERIKSNGWFVSYPDGTMRGMTDAEFEDEFVPLNYSENS